MVIGSRGTGGVTGAGLLQLLGGFTYSGTGTEPGDRQTFTLQGLTPGVTYESRIYIRPWNTEGTGRPIQVSFNNGSQSAAPTPPDGLLEDRPDQVIVGNPHSAYYLGYTYVAESTEMSIDAIVPDTAPGFSGSFHMYGLTNQVISTDADSDGLPDAYEVAVAGNTTDLNGLGRGPGPGPGTGDFDGDTLTDLEEYNLSLGDYPGIDPTDEDSDDDNLSDGEEIAGAGMRPPTDPTKTDTDSDTLTDDAETNTGLYVGISDTGTDPTKADTDDDGLSDGAELDAGSNPHDTADPTEPVIPAIGQVVLTDPGGPGGSAEISFRSEPGRRYAIQFSIDLEAWLDTDHDDILAGSTMTTRIDTVAIRANQRCFYRVVVR